MNANAGREGEKGGVTHVAIFFFLSSLVSPLIKSVNTQSAYTLDSSMIKI